MPGLYMVLDYVPPAPNGWHVTWMLAFDPYQPEAWVYQSCQDRGPIVTVLTVCRCGDRGSFRVCSGDAEDLIDGVAHRAPWCAYCREALAEHELIEVHRD